MVDAIELHLVAYIYRVRQSFGYIGKKFIHLRLGLHPLLLGVKHTLGVIQVLTRTQTYQAVVRFGILFIHKMHIVGTHQLHIVLLGVFHQFCIGHLLQIKGFMIGTRHGGLMPLQLQVKIIAKHPLVPLDSLFGLIQFSLNDFARHFARHTSRTDNQSFVIFLQLHPIGTRTHIISLRPCLRHQFYQVMIASLILGQHHQVITALVVFSILII